MAKAKPSPQLAFDLAPAAAPSAPQPVEDPNCVMVRLPKPIAFWPFIDLEDEREPPPPTPAEYAQAADVAKYLALFVPTVTVTNAVHDAWTATLARLLASRRPGS